MIKKHKRIAIFGGSNCRMKFGLQYGLSKSFDIANYSLGASTSYQRLFELCKCREEIANYDYIILESSLNDIHCHHNTGIRLNYLLEHIDETYRAFSETGIPVLSILWPIRYDLIFSQTDAALCILNRHKVNTELYGMLMFDAVNYIRQNFPVALNYLFYDGLHLNAQLACELGECIAEYLTSHSAINTKTNNFHNLSNNDHYIIVGAEKISQTFGLQILERANSTFRRQIVTLEKTINLKAIAPDGYILVGIENWSELHSCLVIQNSEFQRCKLLNNKYLAFNEIHHPLPVSPESIIRSGGPQETVTEFAINSPRKSDIQLECVGITSLFFSKPHPFNTTIKIPTSQPSLQPSCISRTFPPYSPFRSSAEILYKNYRHMSFDPAINLNFTIDLLRDSAIALKKKDLKIAYTLISHALQLRPSGLTLIQKAQEFEDLLSKSKKNKLVKRIIKKLSLMTAAICHFFGIQKNKNPKSNE